MQKSTKQGAGNTAALFIMEKETDNNPNIYQQKNG